MVGAGIILNETIHKMIPQKPIKVRMIQSINWAPDMFKS